MKCTKCSTEINEDSKFCPECGQENNVTDQPTTREESIKKMESYLEFYGAYLNDYIERDKAFNKLSIDSRKPNMTRYFLLFLAGSFVIEFLFQLITVKLNFLIALVISAVLVVLLYRYQLKKQQEKLENSTQYYNELQNKLQKNYDFNNYKEVGFEYTSPEVLAVLHSYLLSGRADTIKEAINCLLDDHHKQQQLNLQRQQLNVAQQAANNMNQQITQNEKYLKKAKKQLRNQRINK